MLHQTFNFAAANYLTPAPSSYQGLYIPLKIGERIRCCSSARHRRLPALCISLCSQRISGVVVAEMVILPHRNASISFARHQCYTVRGCIAQGRQEVTFSAHLALAMGSPGHRGSSSPRHLHQLPPGSPRGHSRRHSFGTTSYSCSHARWEEKCPRRALG